MLSSPSFASGSGLSILIRTTRMDGKFFSYSHISGTAVGIGNNVLEVQQDRTLLVNGKRHVNNHASLPTEFATYPFTKNMIGKKKKITQYVLNITDTNIGGVHDKSKIRCLNRWRSQSTPFPRPTCFLSRLTVIFTMASVLEVSKFSVPIFLILLSCLYIT